MAKVTKVGLYLCGRVAQLRKELSLTREEFADKIDRTENFVCIIETGYRQPGVNTIDKICNAFNITPNYFFEEHSLDGLPRSAAQAANDYSKLTSKNKRLVTELIHALSPKKQYTGNEE